MESVSPPREDRRHFLQSITLAGAAALVPMPVFAQAEKNNRIENRFFAVRFDMDSGRLYLYRKGTAQPLLDAVTRALIPGQPRSLDEAVYTRTVEMVQVNDVFGAGEQLRIAGTDTTKQLDFALTATLYNERDLATFEVRCTNVSNADLNLVAIEPLSSETCHWPGIGNVLTNGRMYYDPGKVLEFTRGETISSCWNIGFHRGDNKPGLVAGYLENNLSLGYVHAENHGGDFALRFESRYEDGFLLRPGASIGSDRVVLAAARTPFAALESYAGAIGDAHAVHLNPVANGWCSWSYAYEGITETEMQRVAAFAARHLRPYGLEYIQVDDGFYRAFGDWEGNEKFPHGMKWLAERIRELGLKPAIWLAPYVISEGTDVHVNHPDWLLRKPNGHFLQAKPGGDTGDDEDNGGKPKRFALDI